MLNEFDKAYHQMPREACNKAVEDVDHVPYRCNTARLCWIMLVPQHAASTFFSKPFEEWLHWNLNPRIMRTHWRLIFSVVAWKLWTNINKRILTDEIITPHCIVRSAYDLVYYNVKAHGFLQSLDHEA